MKQPTAPLYPELLVEDERNYRLQKISEIEKTLINERDVRKSLYKKYKRGIVCLVTLKIGTILFKNQGFDFCCSF